jgi:RNA polymerase sigma-70 factor (ECF subfamily)
VTEREPPDSLSPAIDAVLARFAGAVRAIGARYRVHGSELDDLLQEVRIRLWRARETSEQIAGTPASYLHRVATTAALDMLRRRRARPAVSLEEDVTATKMPKDARPLADARLESSEIGAIVSLAIGEITPSRQLVVRLYLSGYDREEVGELLGWSEAKVRNLLYRGLAELRERLTARGVTAGGAR